MSVVMKHIVAILVMFMFWAFFNAIGLNIGFIFLIFWAPLILLSLIFYLYNKNKKPFHG